MLGYINEKREGIVFAGGLLDYESVKEGLQSGQIGHLGLDVQWEEPFDPQDWIAQHPRCAHLCFLMSVKGDDML